MAQLARQYSAAAKPASPLKENELTQYLNERLNSEDGDLEEDIIEIEPIDDDPEVRARFIADCAYAVKAEDIAALDLRGLTIIADFFVVCTGNSSIQIRAIANRIEDGMREQGFKKLRAEGYQEASWVLLDYGDVVAHVMAAEQREFYQLEKFWAEAPRLELGLEPDR